MTVQIAKSALHDSSFGRHVNAPVKQKVFKGIVSQNLKPFRIEICINIRILVFTCSNPSWK